MNKTNEKFTYNQNMTHFFNSIWSEFAIIIIDIRNNNEKRVEVTLKILFLDIHTYVYKAKKKIGFNQWENKLHKCVGSIKPSYRTPHIRCTHTLQKRNTFFQIKNENR